MDLIAELRREPTEEERALAEGVGLHDGAHVPFHMFAKVALRQERDADALAEVSGLRKWFRRRARVALAALAANLAGLGGYTAHRIAASAVAEERERQQTKDIARMEEDIRALRRLCGLDPQATTIVQLAP